MNIRGIVGWGISLIMHMLIEHLVCTYCRNNAEIRFYPRLLGGRHCMLHCLRTCILYRTINKHIYIIYNYCYLIPYL